MKVIDTDNAMFFDVDDTLVMWGESELYKNRVTVLDPYTKEDEELYINDSHVKLLKRCKQRGKTVVVWSHGGFRWAEAVVKALELEEYVDLVMTKMEDYVDDLNVEQWATKNIYLNKGYGR